MKDMITQEHLVSRLLATERAARQKAETDLSWLQTSKDRALHDTAAAMTRELGKWQECAVAMNAALLWADQFIKNGTEYGYIQMPDRNTPDTARLTPGLIKKALAAFEKLKGELK